MTHQLRHAVVVHVQPGRELDVVAELDGAAGEPEELDAQDLAETRESWSSDEGAPTLAALCTPGAAKERE